MYKVLQKKIDFTTYLYEDRYKMSYFKISKLYTQCRKFFNWKQLLAMAADIFNFGYYRPPPLKIYSRKVIFLSLSRVFNSKHLNEIGHFRFHTDSIDVVSGQNRTK